jgi:hypothetical protein
MTNRRAKAYATATVLGLGALGGFALGSNPGSPVVSGQASGGGAHGATAVVTSASGATTAVGTEATQATTAGTRAPIVTRTSGAAGGVPTDD